MWHADILKKLDTLLLVCWGQIQSPPESLERMQVFYLQQTAWGKKISFCYPWASFIVQAVFRQCLSTAFHVGLTVIYTSHLSYFARLSIYVTNTMFQCSMASCLYKERSSHGWQWVFRFQQINWKEEAGRKEEKSLIVAERMCFCLLWIVSSSPL